MLTTIIGPHGRNNNVANGDYLKVFKHTNRINDNNIIIYIKKHNTIKVCIIFSVLV